MTHRIDQLERSGLVKRIPDPDDRWGILIELTDEGFDRIEQAVTAHVANEHQVLSTLKPAEREALTGLLRKLLLSFEAE